MSVPPAPETLLRLRRPQDTSAGGAAIDRNFGTVLGEHAATYSPPERFEPLGHRRLGRRNSFEAAVAQDHRYLLRVFGVDLQLHEQRRPDASLEFGHQPAVIVPNIKIGRASCR